MTSCRMYEMLCDGFLAAETFVYRGAGMSRGFATVCYGLQASL